MLPLSEISCTELKGVGAKIAEALGRLDIYTVQDLLLHLPMRYQDRARQTQISHLNIGDTASVTGVLVKCYLARGRRTSLMCRMEDDSGPLNLRFFNYSKYQFDFFSKKIGKALSCFGEIKRGSDGLEMFHPELQWLEEETSVSESQKEQTLTPIYSLSKGLNQVMFRKYIDQALVLLKKVGLEEVFSDELLDSLDLPEITQAVEFLHKPPLSVSLDRVQAGQYPAQHRLILEELVAHQASLRKLRQKVNVYPARALSKVPEIEEAFLSSLPFELTSAQKRSFNEIAEDLKQPFPMMRLLQGDVGSGKTIVAGLSILRAIEGGHQVALMAPTELLAEQHYKTLKSWFEPLGIRIAFLVGSLKAGEKREALKEIAEGSAQVAVGTHALFQASVEFKLLVLSIIDEQHRFGVSQRLALKEKGEGVYHPHQLIMTATPIPRTLSMTAYADLEVSIIDELPKARKPISTLLLSNTRREEILERVRKNCQQGKQAYWVCTLIEESEVLQCEAAEATYELLVKALPELSIGLVHGRIKANEKETVMRAFKEKEIDLLVATTVIEVGIDVPNASLMIIENAERLGLAQLHQLRGRVGRGSEQSYCVLIYQTPLSSISKERLAMMRETADGFLIAEKDLELRGPGEVLGVRQSGFMRFKVANLMRDAHLLPKARRITDKILRDSPERIDLIVQRWLPEKEKLISA